MSGWIKLHRKLLEWEWYSKPVVKSVFVHSLLRANHKDGKWQGKDVKRGSYISSVDKLIKELGHSRQEIRTALKHLKSTNELTSAGGTQHTVFTVINYDNYQGLTSEATNEQPTANQPLTTNNNVKNEKNEKNDDAGRINYTEIMDYYNEQMPHKKIKKMTDKRKALVKKLFDKTKIDTDTFKAFIDHISGSPDWAWTRENNTGANGVNYGARPFEYYMTEDNLIKAMED